MAHATGIPAFQVKKRLTPTYLTVRLCCRALALAVWARRSRARGG